VQLATVGQASRLAGVNPVDISTLLVHLERLETAPEGMVCPDTSNGTARLYPGEVRP
jgi:hypothetical protein